MTNEPLDFIPARKLALRLGSPITRKRDGFAKIAWLARYDVLTGLPNRQTLGAAMYDAVQGHTRCAFLMIDLDRFKAVNDSHGHPVGDRLLVLVADRLKSLTSKTELCGRLGGDEFAMVIRYAADQVRVDRLAQAVVDRLSAPYTVENQVLNIGASVGAALSPGGGNSVDALMRNADLALYRAKDLGGGQVCRYEPALLAQAEARRKFEHALRHALGGDEFQLEYQPVVDTLDERVVSFEALLRWHNLELGTVAPSRFMPLAEATRLIVPIGNWVMQQACLQASRWPAYIRVAVNVSGEQLVDPQFLDSVVDALATANLSPERLEIEVTERIFLCDAAKTRMVLEQVMALGCAVALNHFGTGLSSLGHIHALRFSTIKLDRCFVQGAARGDRQSLAVIRAVVAMAESLDLATTAEGVETTSELALVRSLGCRRIQGYYYGRPMGGEDSVRLFADERKCATVSAG